MPRIGAETSLSSERKRRVGRDISGGAGITKKDRRAEKRRHLVQKILTDASHRSNSERKSNRKKQKRANAVDDDDDDDDIDGNNNNNNNDDDGNNGLLRLRASMLPALLESARETHERRKRSAMQLSVRERQQLEADEAAKFQAVLRHPAFRDDPLATIGEHLSNQLDAEREQRAHVDGLYEIDERDAELKRNEKERERLQRHRDMLANQQKEQAHARKQQKSGPRVVKKKQPRQLQQAKPQARAPRRKQIGGKRRN
jgi:Ribosome biogenesis protein SLX9